VRDPPVLVLGRCEERCPFFIVIFFCFFLSVVRGGRGRGRRVFNFINNFDEVSQAAATGFRPDICGSHPANRSLVQQRFALLWGRGACGVSNCKMQKKKSNTTHDAQWQRIIIAQSAEKRWPATATNVYN